MGEDAGRDQNPKGTTSAWQCPDQWETPGLEGVRTGIGEGGNHTAPRAPGGTGATAGVDGGKILTEGEKNASLLRNQLGQECGHLRTGNYNSTTETENSDLTFSSYLRLWPRSEVTVRRKQDAVVGYRGQTLVPLSFQAT